MEVTVSARRTKEQLRKEHIDYIQQRLTKGYWVNDSHNYKFFYIYKKNGLLSSNQVATIYFDYDNKSITVEDKDLYDMLEVFGEKFGYTEIEKDYDEAVTENRIRTGKATIRTDDPGPYTKPTIPKKKPKESKTKTTRQHYNESIGTDKIIDFYKWYRMDFELQDIPEDEQWQNLQNEQPEIYEKWIKWFKESAYRKDLKTNGPKSYYHLFNRWLFDYCFLGIPDIVYMDKKTFNIVDKTKVYPLRKEIENSVKNLDLIIENTDVKTAQEVIKLRNKLIITLNKLPKEIRKGWSSRMYKANELIKGE